MQLAAVLEAGSVSEGAALLGQTQPAVSRSLASLESRVGRPLFVKNRRPLEATPLGTLLAAQGRAILAASRKASHAVQGHIKGTSGSIRVGGVPFLMDAVFSRMIGGFHRAEPDIAVEQFYGHVPELVSMLEGGQIDFALTPISDLGLENGFEFTHCLTGHNVVACRTGHPLTKKDGLQAYDLCRYPWVSPLPGSPLLTDLNMIMSTIGIAELKFCYSGATLAGTLHFLGETDALAIMPFFCVHAERRQNLITKLSYEIPQPIRPIGILRKSRNPSTPACERIMSYLQSSFRDLRQNLASSK